MKITIIFLLLILISNFGFSQLKIGVEGAYNSASFAQGGESAVAGYANSPSAISTFNAGIIAEIPVAKKIFLEPGLLYFGNGAHIKGHGDISGYQGYSYTTIQLYYLRLPVNVAYKVKLSDQFEILVGTGLYAAKGLWGTAKGNGEGSSPTAGPYAYYSKEKVDYTNDNSSSSQNNAEIKLFDFGLNILAAIEWKHFQVSANYSYGFTQIYMASGYNYRNKVLAVSLAYLFYLR